MWSQKQIFSDKLKKITSLTINHVTRNVDKFAAMVKQNTSQGQIFLINY